MKTLKTLSLAALALTLAGALAAPASAQGHFGVSFEKHKKNRHFSVSFGFPFGGGHREHRHVHSDCCRQWVPPHCETVTERIWVPERCERVWVPPVYDTIHDPCGGYRRVLVREGYWATERRPGYFEYVSREVTVPGRWEYTCGY